MAVALVQSVDTGTTVNSPTSITPTLPGGSTAGNLLVMSVTATGTSPTITLPANWTSVINVAQANVAHCIFSYPNNPGGITATAVTVSATNGGAVACVLEFSGVGASAYQQAGNITQVSGTSAAPPPSPTRMVNAQGSLVFTCLGYQATTFIPGVASPEWQISNPLINAVSTTATTNAQHSGAWCVTGYGPLQIGNTFGTSVSWIGLGCHFNNVGTFPVSNSQIGGVTGTITPFFQGMIGG